MINGGEWSTSCLGWFNPCRSAVRNELRTLRQGTTSSFLMLKILPTIWLPVTYAVDRGSLNGQRYKRRFVFRSLPVLIAVGDHYHNRAFKFLSRQILADVTQIVHDHFLQTWLECFYMTCKDAPHRLWCDVMAVYRTYWKKIRCQGNCFLDIDVRVYCIVYNPFQYNICCFLLAVICLQFFDTFIFL
jgi:hypothetical protein